MIAPQTPTGCASCTHARQVVTSPDSNPPRTALACCRNSPAPVISPAGGAHWQRVNWPIVQPTDSCGDYSAPAAAAAPAPAAAPALAAAPAA